MNAILCSRGKGGGCRAVTIGEEGLRGGSAPSNVAPQGHSEADAPSVLSPNSVAVLTPEPPAVYWPPARTERSPNLVAIPANTPPERCTGAKCRARKEGPALIFKVKHPKTGNMTPAAVADMITLAKDGALVPTGAFGPYIDAAPGREPIMKDGMGYNHFIDCPDSAAFKRK